MVVPIAIASIAFLMLSLRLMRTAFRAEGAEGWLALFFLATALALPVRMLGAEGDVGDGKVASAIVLTGHFLMSAAVCGYTFFIERVFRGPELWARLLVASIVALELLVPPLLILVGGHRDEHHPFVFAVGMIRALPFLWGFIEVLRYHRQMKRRLALGLADPIVTNRFALFAIWNGALFALPVFVVGVRLWVSIATGGEGLHGSSETSQLLLNLVRVGLVGFACTAFVAAYLSFFPPRAYLDRIGRQAAAES